MGSSPTPLGTFFGRSSPVAICGLLGHYFGFGDAVWVPFSVEVRLSLFDLWTLAFRFVDVALGPVPCGPCAVRLNTKTRASCFQSLLLTLKL